MPAAVSKTKIVLYLNSQIKKTSTSCMLGRAVRAVNTSVKTPRIAVAMRSVYTVVVEATVYAVNVNHREGLVNEMESVRKMSDAPTLDIVSGMTAKSLVQERSVRSGLTAGQIVVAAVDIVSVVTLIWKELWKKSKPLQLGEGEQLSDELYAVN